MLLFLSRGRPKKASSSRSWMRVQHRCSSAQMSRRPRKTYWRGCLRPTLISAQRFRTYFAMPGFKPKPKSSISPSTITYTRQDWMKLFRQSTSLSKSRCPRQPLQHLWASPPFRIYSSRSRSAPTQLSNRRSKDRGAKVQWFWRQNCKSRKTFC